MLTTWRISFPLPIWRVCFESLTGVNHSQQMVLELRDKQQVAWAGVDVLSGQTLWQKKMETADWWTGLVGLYNGYALFHQYTDHTQPAPRGLMVMDARTGTLAWEIVGKSFVKADSNGVHTIHYQSDQSPTYEYFNWQGNAITGTILANELSEAPIWQHPDVYETDHSYYLTLKNFIQKTVGHQAETRIFYGEITDNVVFSYYFYQPNAFTLSHSLLVVDASKTVLWHESFEDAVPQAVFEAFTYTKNRMIFLNHSNEITILNFSQHR